MRMKRTTCASSLGSSAARSSQTPAVRTTCSPSRALATACAILTNPLLPSPRGREAPSAAGLGGGHRAQREGEGRTGLGVRFPRALNEILMLPRARLYAPFTAPAVSYFFGCPRSFRYQAGSAGTREGGDIYAQRAGGRGRVSPPAHSDTQSGAAWLHRGGGRQRRRSQRGD